MSDNAIGEAVSHAEVFTLPWSDALIEKVAKHLWSCTMTRHRLPWSDLPECAKRGTRNEARAIEQIIRLGWG